MIEEAEDFFRDYRRGRAKSTVDNTRSDIRRFSEFLQDREATIYEVDSALLEDYFHKMNRENYSDHTIRNRYRSVRQLLDYVNIEEESENPADQFRISKYAGRKNKREEEALEKRFWLSRDDINKLVEAAPQPVVRNRCIILFMYYTACRRSEVCEVKLQNMDLDARKARVNSPKTGKTITVRWQPHLDPLLDEWLETHREAYTTSDSGYLFITQQASKIAPNHVSRIVREAAKRAGIQDIAYEDKSGNKRRRVTSHALRHSFATHWLQPPNKGSLEELQEILAHEDIQTTQVYTEIVEDQIDQAYTEHAPTIEYNTSSEHNRQVCERCGKEGSQMETHHVSYNPEETMEVCQTCHREIEDDSNDKYDYLQAAESREEAKGNDWTPY